MAIKIQDVTNLFLQLWSPIKLKRNEITKIFLYDEQQQHVLSDARRASILSMRVQSVQHFFLWIILPVSINVLCPESIENLDGGWRLYFIRAFLWRCRSVFVYMNESTQWTFFCAINIIYGYIYYIQPFMDITRSYLIDRKAAA